MMCSYICMGVDRVPNDVQTFAFQLVRELDTIRIVHVDYRIAWARTEAAVEQSLLCVPIVLHRPVIVEMVAGEISEDGNGILQFVATMKIHRLRRALHHRGATTDLDGLSKQALHVRRFGRRA